MAQPTDMDELLGLLALTIGTIMEDEVVGALARLPDASAERIMLFDKLAVAGRDIATLAAAGEALLHRSS